MAVFVADGMLLAHDADERIDGVLARGLVPGFVRHGMSASADWLRAASGR